MLLESRFAHKREIVNSTLLKIINLPSLATQSAAGINNILTTVDSSLRILETFKINVASWDPIVNILIISKLDNVTRRDFENTHLDDQLIPYSNLSKFLANRARALAILPIKSNFPNNFKASSSSSKGPAVTTTVTNNNSIATKSKSAPVCPLCKTPHFFIHCEKFKNMSIKERKDVFHSTQSCFSKQHTVSECKKDPCKRCGKRHHRLLHVESTSAPSSQTLHVSSPSASSPSTSSSALLATALVRVDEEVLRSIVDFGSSRHLITERGAQQLNLKRRNCTIPVFGAGYRFVSRRGICSQIWSDQGTNVVGTNNELKDLNFQLQELTVDPDLLQELANFSIQWKFNPPSAPHLGGLWEAAVKSVKHHLRRAVTSALFSLEELLTLLCQIEACLNSRPLVAMSTDPSDFQVLTPGHFLIGQPLSAIPEPDLTSVKLNHLNRWQLVQRQVQHFWRRWSTEYLHTLQSRSKWQSTKENIEVDDLVIIKEDLLPAMKWKIGRVIKTGTDSKVRIVTIRIPHVKPPKKGNRHSSEDKSIVTFSQLDRLIHKLIKLPVPTRTEDTST